MHLQIAYVNNLNLNALQLNPSIKITGFERIPGVLEVRAGGQAPSPTQRYPC